MNSELKKWLRFLAGCAGIVVFLYLVPRVFKILPQYRKISKTVSEKNIDVSALFYSEESNSYSSEKIIKEKLRN